MKKILIVLLFFATPCFGGEFQYNGVKYKSFAEFKKTDAYVVYQLKNQIAALKWQLARDEKEQNREKAVEFERNRRRYSAATQFWMDQKERHDILARKALGEAAYRRLRDPGKYDEKSVLFQATARVANKYGITREESLTEHTDEVMDEMTKDHVVDNYKVKVK